MNPNRNSRILIEKHYIPLELYRELYNIPAYEPVYHYATPYNNMQNNIVENPYFTDFPHAPYMPQVPTSISNAFDTTRNQSHFQNIMNYNSNPFDFSLFTHIPPPLQSIPPPIPPPIPPLFQDNMTNNNANNTNNTTNHKSKHKQ
jgi:hypothetical protein